jgi:serine protease Do
LKFHHKRYFNSSISSLKGSFFRFIVCIAFVFVFLGASAGVGCIVMLFESGNNPIAQDQHNKNIVPIALAVENDTMTVPQIVKKVGPAVVGVSTKSIVHRTGRTGVGILEGIGSGFIINEDGYVLTNYHVIQGAQEVKVIFNNSKEFTAKVINYDSSQDIAVVKIIDNIDVPGIVELGDSDSLETGETVIAIGNPLGKEFIGSVTAGIVSAVNRDIEVQGRKLNLVQTDAAINPGNSGGPLLNSYGQVIGINTAKIGTNGVEGIGFAIPINTVKLRLTALSKPLLKLGVIGTNINEELSKKDRLPVGIHIKEIEPGSSAERAGLKIGDVIVKFDDHKVATIDDISKLKERKSSGDIVNVQVIRNNKTINVTLVLRE